MSVFTDFFNQKKPERIYYFDKKVIPKSINYNTTFYFLIK